jgi:DNA-binding response OmpR family regulator
MPVVLICAPRPLDGELSHSVLWRHDIERYDARSYEQALSMAVAAQPDLTVIDRTLPKAAELVRSLRIDPKSRHTSVVIVAHGDFESAELDLLEAGANAILRLPADAHWDERLDRLLRIPARKEARFEVDFAVETTLDVGPPTNGDALNLSTHGLLLKTTTTLTVGDRISFAFRLPGALVVGRARVVRQAGAGQFGVLFESLEKDGRARIEAFIASLPPA